MLPSRVIYKGKEFETIGFIKFNNGSFLMLKNDEDIISLDLSKINLKLDLKFEIKEATKVEIVLINYILEAIKNGISNGKYQNKEDLKKDIVGLNKYVNTHPELLSNMKELDFKDDIVDAKIHELLSYFDDVMKDAPLNLEGITSFQINGKNYIKYKDENDRVKIMDDNVDNRNFVEQFRKKQNESNDFKQEDGKQSALNIAEDMNKYQKTSVQLEEVDDIKQTSFDLSTEAMKKYDEKSDKDIVGNVDKGVFYDENNNQILATEKKDDKVVVSEVKETTHTEYNNGVTTNVDQLKVMDYPPYDEEIVTQYLKTKNLNNISMFINKYLYDLTVEQINYLLDNYSLSQEQIFKLNAQKSTKIVQAQPQKEKSKAKVLTLKKQNAAFVDTLLLSFIVGLISGMYLIFLILIIMS